MLTDGDGQHGPVIHAVVQVPDGETSALEAWKWLTDDPYVRVVEATLDNESEGCQVLVGVANLLRDNALDSEFRWRVTAALASASGVTEVENEGGGVVWYVTGRPSGKALVVAAAQVVDDLADRLRAHIESAGVGR